MASQELGNATEPLTFSRFAIQEIKFGTKVNFFYFESRLEFRNLEIRKSLPSEKTKQTTNYFHLSSGRYKDSKSSNDVGVKCNEKQKPHYIC